ncbi:MAG: histidinol dehydrogenase, partial [Pseudomonadota bacterium]
MPHHLRHDAPDFEERFRALLTAQRGPEADVSGAVGEIIAEIRAHGIDAVVDYTRRFDGWDATEETLAFTAQEIDA